MLERRLDNPGRFTFLVTGPIDETTLPPVVERTLGALQTKQVIPGGGLIPWRLPKKKTALVDHTVFDFLQAALSTDLVGTRGYERADVIATAMHFQQLTGPVMAKSLEDTAFYRYNRLISLNEVGGDPGHFGVSPSAFHHLMHQQQQRLPASMLTTATHDPSLRFSPGWSRTNPVRCFALGGPAV